MSGIEKIILKFKHLYLIISKSLARVRLPMQVILFFSLK
jgi:hypothetical protein